MSRDITHETRLRLLREDAASHGLKWTEPDAVRDNESSDWTGQIHRARRVLEDPASGNEQRQAARDWLRDNSGVSRAPQTWGG
jgi:hypothetical protein